MNKKKDLVYRKLIKIKRTKQLVTKFKIKGVCIMIKALSWKLTRKPTAIEHFNVMKYVKATMNGKGIFVIPPINILHTLTKVKTGVVITGIAGRMEYLMVKSYQVWYDFKNEITEMTDEQLRSMIEDHLNKIKDKPSHSIIDKINVTLGIDKNEQEERLVISQIK